MSLLMAQTPAPAYADKAFKPESTLLREAAAPLVDVLHASLHESESRYRTLFNLSPVAVYSIDAQGRIREFNLHAAALWGKTPTIGDTDQRFCGSHRMFLPDGTFLPHHRCPMATVVSGEITEARDAQVVIERPDGSRITVIVNIVQLKDDAGQVIGAINCFYDITERSRLEQQIQLQTQALTDLHQRKDEFLAMLSHELRNPLAPILNAVQLLRRSGGEQQHSYACDVIERQAGQLVRLINDLMEVSRITSGRIHLDRKRVLVSAVVAQALETTRPLLDGRGHEVTVALPVQPIWIDADAARIEQVLVNLLTNAAKFSEPGTPIRLGVKAEGALVAVSVRDQGIGISPGVLPHVFDLFTQADKSLDRAQGGLGIGLALVKQLVDLHAGTTGVTSTLGQGSEFEIRLPIAVATVPTQPAPIVVAGEPERERCKVLVVDDNPDAVEILGQLLQACGHDVQLASDGPAALTAALQHRPDVILLDIGLPGLSGYEVARQIRQQPALAGVMLVAVTGYGQREDRRRSLDAGFDHHLVKPLDLEELEKWLARARPARELA